MASEQMLKSTGDIVDSAYPPRYRSVHLAAGDALISSNLWSPETPLEPPWPVHGCAATLDSQQRSVVFRFQSDAPTEAPAVPVQEH